jgi:hypothetical protein
MTTNFEVKRFATISLTGYATQMELPTMENIKEISQEKSNHFFKLANSGQFPALMKGSVDQIGYAFSSVQAGQLMYFAGANTTIAAATATKVEIAAGDYVVLKGQGGPSRQLFDQLIATFFAEILPKHPEIYPEDRFVVEALLNGNPQDAVVELRIPVS